MTEPVVSILTFCAHPVLAYGTLLVFKTLRIGFPTARVEVFDNGSHPAVVEQIRQACEDVGATFTPMTPKHYADHYKWLLLERKHDGSPLVLVDPDVVFWQDVQGWNFGGALMAGRLIPDQRDGRTISLARLHPSLLWVPDIASLRETAQYLDDAIGSRFEVEGGRIMFHDTLEPLYAALKSQCVPFDESHLDCFDHLFYGSHLPLMAGCEHDGFDAIEAGHHAAACGDLERLRGIWRTQEEYFLREHHSARSNRIVGAVACALELQELQGLCCEDTGGAMLGLGLRLSMSRRAP